MNVNLRNKILRQITLTQVDVSLLRRKIQVESFLSPALVDHWCGAFIVRSWRSKKS